MVVTYNTNICTFMLCSILQLFVYTLLVYYFIISFPLNHLLDQLHLLVPRIEIECFSALVPAYHKNEMKE